MIREYIIKVNDDKKDIMGGMPLIESPQEIIRCKDCKHRPVKPENYKKYIFLEFPDSKCPCQCDDGFYSWYPEDNWFCANGERT